MTKDWINLVDLRTHVCFYLAHPGCSALYDGTMGHEQFWRRLCWSCGLGQLPDEWNVSDDDWHDIAIECAGRDGFCTLAHCGESLLEYNRMFMNIPLKSSTLLIVAMSRCAYAGERQLYRAVRARTYQRRLPPKRWKSQVHHPSRPLPYRLPYDRRRKQSPSVRG